MELESVLSSFRENPGGLNAGSAGYTYDAFGRVMSAATPEFGHSTKPLDPATGFSWFGYRSYAPEIGRWLTRDPIGFSGGLNFYAYVGNNPVNAVDPFGLAEIIYDWLIPGNPDDTYTRLITPPAPVTRMELSIL